MMVERGHEPRAYVSPFTTSNSGNGTKRGGARSSVPNRCKLSRDESLFLAKLEVGVAVRTATGGGAGGGSERCTQCTRLKSNPKCVCDGEAPGRASGGGGGRTGDVSKKVVAMLTIRVLVCAKWRIRRRPRVDAARKIARCWRRYRSWCMVLDRLASLSAQYRSVTSERLDHACRVIQTWWRVRGKVFSDTCCVCYEDKVERILVGNGKTVSVFVDNPCGHKVSRGAKDPSETRMSRMCRRTKRKGRVHPSNSSLRSSRFADGVRICAPRGTASV